jgi:hypothetical protein
VNKAILLKGGGTLLRAAIAIAGGYAVAALVACCLALWLPLELADAVAAGQMVSFAVFAFVALVSFAARDLGQLLAAFIASIILLGGGVAITLWMSLP